MDYNEYISVAKRKFKEVKVTDNDIDFLINNLLQWELKHGSFSTYKIYSHLKDMEDFIAYKNVHLKIRKLFSCGLIEEVEGKYFHGAKFYRISPNGWFNLILRGVFNYALICKPAITKYYNDNIIFKTFIFPYFEIETLRHFSDSTIGMYLYDCCQTTLLSIEALKPDGEKIFEVSREKRLERIINDKYIMDIIDVNESITDELDLQIKSFLFEQIITNSRMQSVLSKDKKFMAAIEDIEKEFRTEYNKVMELKNKK
jgi:hypothetical protein